MTVYEVEKIVCRRCHAVLDVGDRFCRVCGAPTEGPIDPPLPNTARSARDRPPRVADNPATILFLLFAVLGPLALPLLWRSRRIATPWKIILTLLVALVTAAVVGLLWYMIQMFIEPLKELRQLKGFG